MNILINEIYDNVSNNIINDIINILKNNGYDKTQLNYDLLNNNQNFNINNDVLFIQNIKNDIKELLILNNYNFLYYPNQKLSKLYLFIKQKFINMGYSPIL
jgi:hypothetical protein